MRLLEAIIDANHRALAGDANAGLHPAEFGDELPIVALTCVDARLNTLLPQVLGVPPEKFIWLRNAGNIITGPTSSTIRSLVLACAVKGGKEIAIIGHSDCQVGKTSTLQLIDALRALGIERHLLPDNLNEFFGLFSSERQNVIKATEIARSSSLISPKTPVHGMLVDIETGRVEWIVNGYQTLQTAAAAPWNEVVKSAGQTVDAFKALTDFKIGDLKFPDTKIGEIASYAEKWAADKIQARAIKPQPTSGPGPAPGTPPKIPMPPPLRAKIRLRAGPGPK